MGMIHIGPKEAIAALKGTSSSYPEAIKYVDRVVEVPVEKIVEVERRVEVERIVEVEKIVEVERVVEIEKPVEVLVEKVVTKVVEKPVHVDVPVYLDRITVRYQIPNYMWIAVGVEAVIIFSMLTKLVS